MRGDPIFNRLPPGSATERVPAVLTVFPLEEDLMVEEIVGGTLLFVVLSALVVLFWLNFKNGGRSSKERKEKPDSTVI